MYNVGDKVWWAKCGNRDVKKPCPICFGKKQVTLILGNDDTVILPCNYCMIGYEGPFGYIEETKYIAKPKYISITGVNIEKTSDGDKIEYRYGSYILYENRVFDNKEDALICCEGIKKQVEAEQRTRTEHIKADKKKSYSWNAGYHFSEVKRYEEKAAYHRDMAKICKGKAR